MKLQVFHNRDHKAQSHHQSAWRSASRLETYMATAMVVAAAVLLILLAYGIMNTGDGTPSWMR